MLIIIVPTVNRMTYLQNYELILAQILLCQQQVDDSTAVFVHNWLRISLMVPLKITKWADEKTMLLDSWCW